MAKKITSIYKGVSWDFKNSKWVASIRYNHKRLHLGYFYCEWVAAMAYNKKYFEMSGEESEPNIYIGERYCSTLLNGVLYDTQENTWISLPLKTFNSPIQAAEEHDNMEKAAYGEQAKLNFKYVTCPFCGKTVIAKMNKQTTCGSYACRKKQDAQDTKKVKQRLAANRCCVICGKPLGPDRTVQRCPECVNKYINYIRNKQKKNRENGVCSICGRKRGYLPNGKQSAYCQHHYELAHNASMRRTYKTFVRVEFKNKK
jgi:hypothetical protein